jgi:phosphate transport system substrate-binding protein
MKSNSCKYLIILILTSYSCSFKPTKENEIKIVGSDTMLELTSNLAEQYMKENSGISIIVEGGGTGTGINALIKNQTDICTASRNLKPDEAKLLADYYGSLGLVFLIAKDALSIYVNPKNNISSLTQSELKKIFTGEIKNWKVLGGKDSSIVPIIRNPNSGTYLYFKDHVLEGEDYSDNSETKPTTKDIIKFIEKNENAIGCNILKQQYNWVHSN